MAPVASRRLGSRWLAAAALLLLLTAAVADVACSSSSGGSGGDGGGNVPTAAAAAAAVDLPVLTYPLSGNDVQALQVLQEAWADSLSELRGWIQPVATACTVWQGVSCAGPDPAGNMRVSKLSLPGLNITGPLPLSVANLTALNQLSLPGNMLTGVVPDFLPLSLIDLNLAGNQFSGPLPFLASSLSLESLDLEMNQLEGSIPESWRELFRSLEFVDLSHNAMLDGAIPNWVWSESLQEFHASETGLYVNLTADSDAAALNSSGLQVLHFNNAALSGDIGWLAAFPQLTEVQVANNSLNGSLLLGSLSPQLKNLDASGNQLSHVDFNGTAALLQLHSLQLQNNSLQGAIDGSILELHTLETLDLSYNHLSGFFPEPFSTYWDRLQRCDLRFQASPGLRCPLPSSCLASICYVPHGTSGSVWYRLSPWQIALIVVSATFAVSGVAVLCSLLVYRVRRRRRRMQQYHEIPDFLSENPDISLYDLLRDNGIRKIEESDIQMVARCGSGRSGDVWQARVLSTGEVVAVKKCSMPVHLLDERSLREFLMEIKLLCSLSHPNVVRAVGVCYKERDNDLLLITEYMDQGSLRDVLDRKASNLPFDLRLKLALDAARGMDYLHNCRPAIIHRDLKPQNLLVDSNWTCKIADFGVSSFKRNVTMSVVGTPIYMAPEVIVKSRYSESADVFSFGVMLAELYSGQAPYSESTEWSMFRIMMAVANEGLRPSMPEETPRPFLQLVEDCTRADAEMRPNFAEIVQRIARMRVSSPAASRRATPRHSVVLSGRPTSPLSAATAAAIASPATASTAAPAPAAAPFQDV